MADDNYDEKKIPILRPGVYESPNEQSALKAMQWNMDPLNKGVMATPRTPSDTVHAKGGHVPRHGAYQDGGSVRPTDDPTKAVLGQLSSSYWDRVRKAKMIQDAGRSDTSKEDQQLRDQNDLLSPPGPRPGAAPGDAYAKGGRVKSKPFSFAGGGSANYGKDYSKK